MDKIGYKSTGGFKFAVFLLEDDCAVSKKSGNQVSRISINIVHEITGGVVMFVVNYKLIGGGQTLITRCCRVALAGVGAVALPVVWAQGGMGETATTLDAVVVTANKRVENVQEVPKSVLVVTPETLSKSGVTTIRELGNVIPSISGALPPGRSAAPPIRGISSFSLSIGVPSQTGIVIDDVPQASYSSLFKELIDIERVEVLAGPQSTLSGRNASGGLINIVTRAPADMFAAELTMEQTSDRQQRFSAFITGPLSQTLAFSIAAFSNEWEGHLRSPTETNGNRPLHLNGWDTQGVRSKLRWQPNDLFNATLTLYTMESEQLLVGAFGSAHGAYFFVDPAAVHGFDPFRRTFSEMYPGMTLGKYNTWTESPRHGVYNFKDRGGSLHLEYELGGGSTLTSITSLIKTDMPRLDNFIGMRYGIGPDVTVPGPGYPFAHVDYTTENKTQELRLTSPGEQPFEYMLGLIYTDIDTTHPYQRLGIFPVNWVRAFDMQSAALFSRGTYHVSERDALIAGLRYQRDKMGYAWEFLPLQADATIPDTFVSGNSDYDFISTELSWRHDIADDINAYVTLARTQSGEVYDLEDNRGAMMPGGLQPLDSQKVRNIELGLKSQWWERRLTLNFNAFLAKYDNYHIQTAEVIDVTQAPFIKLFAIGKVQTHGIEFETRLRASENLNLSLNGAWVNAEIRDYPGAQCYPRQTLEQGCVNQLQVDNIAGNSMPGVPKFRVSGAASYFMPLDLLPFDLEFAASYRWQSKMEFDWRGSPDPNLQQRSYGVMNVSAILLDREGRYSVSLFVNNVLDRHFYTRVVDYTGWTAPAYWGQFARDSFRYSGVNVRFNF